MIWGLDYLGGATYKRVILNNHPKGWAAGFFGKTFGNAYPTIQALSKTKKCPLIRVHAVWEDNHRYDPDKHDRVFKNQLKRLINVAKKFPSVHYEFSPFCEHTIGKNMLTKIFKDLKKIIPKDITNISFVNCPWTGDFIYGDPMIKNECHGKNKVPTQGKYNFSYDGEDCYNSNVEADKDKHSNRGDVFFFWTVSFNLKKNEKEKLTVAERMARDYRPNADNVKQCIMFSNKKVKDTVPSTWIIKPMSENVSDAKSNKLLVISPKKGTTMLLEKNGKKVATLSRFTPDYDGKARYYGFYAGYTYGNDAYDVRLDGIKLQPKINPAFRGGKFK